MTLRLDASDVAITAHRTVALQKNVGGGFSTKPFEFQLNHVVLNNAVLGGLPALRRTPLNPVLTWRCCVSFFGLPIPEKTRVLVDYDRDFSKWVNTAEYGKHGGSTPSPDKDNLVPQVTSPQRLLIACN